MTREDTTRRFHVRRAGLEDAPAFTEGRLALFREAEGLALGADHAELEHATRAAYAEQIGNGSTLAWLALDDDQCVGSVALHVFARLPSVRNRVPLEAYVSHVWVHTDWRRNGVATALMRELVAEARARGARRVRLHATEVGRRLYDALGFRLRTNDMELPL